MNNFDNFDDLVKKKMDGMEFPFSEENWQKAAQMIDASRHVAKKSVFKTIAIALIGISITGIEGYFIFTQFAHHTNKTVHADKSNGSEQLSAVASHTENRTLTNAKNHLSENRAPKDNSISSVSANKETTSASEAAGQQRHSTGTSALKTSANKSVVNKNTNNTKKNNNSTGYK